MATPYFSDDRCIEVYVKRAPALRKAACDVTEVRGGGGRGRRRSLFFSASAVVWAFEAGELSIPPTISLALALSGPFRERAHLSYMAFSEEIGSKEFSKRPQENFFSDTHT